MMNSVILVKVYTTKLSYGLFLLKILRNVMSSKKCITMYPKTIESTNFVLNFVLCFFYTLIQLIFAQGRFAQLNFLSINGDLKLSRQYWRQNHKK